VEAAVAVYFPDCRMPTDKQPWNRLPQHLDSVLIQDSERQGGSRAASEENGPGHATRHSFRGVGCKRRSPFGCRIVGRSSVDHPAWIVMAHNLL
jgi:hypothetical protein